MFYNIFLLVTDWCQNRLEHLFLQTFPAMLVTVSEGRVYNSVAPPGPNVMKLFMGIIHKHL